MCKCDYCKKLNNLHNSKISKDLFVYNALPKLSAASFPRLLLSIREEL